jgi:two-component system sensor kinase FixL
MALSFQSPVAQRVIAIALKAGRAKVLIVSAILIALSAFADWYVGVNVSLGILYVLPMILAAIVLKPLEMAGLAIFCSLLRSLFDNPASHVEAVFRFLLASSTYVLSGLFVAALLRNRELVIQNLAKIQREQDLRHEAEEQLRLLVESSPAAILTLDGAGVVLAANNAANALFGVEPGGTLKGRSVGEYLPVLADALRLESGPEAFRTAAQCLGRRQNGEIFLAHTWFSTYAARQGTRLAAIVVDSSEEMRDREEQNLQQLLHSNRITAAAVSHEVRNLCGAISLICSNLKEKHEIAADADFRGLVNLVEGLQRIASVDLHSKVQQTLQKVPLQEVLDNLRIIIEPAWTEIDAVVRWRVPQSMPTVLADPHGLLQAFLNLVQNSFRAVKDCDVRELCISVSVQHPKAIVRFVDSGPGIARPERLFQPLQDGAEGVGLGLYVSRAILRSYGGQLRYEPAEKGSCFAVELQIV